MSEYLDHPIAEIFPLLNGESLRELADSVSVSGLKVPIILFEEMILDGRNRYRACKLAKVEPDFVQYAGDSPVDDVLTWNGVRRDLTPTQKAAVAVEVLSYFEPEAQERMEAGRPKKGREKFPEDTKGKATEHAAKLLGANHHYVSDLKAIKEAYPEIFALCKSGRKTIRQAVREIASEKEKIALAAVIESEGLNWRVENRPCLEALNLEPSASVDCIITDPPYPAEFLPCWDDLGRVAVHTLKASGSLIAMSGQSYLPEIVGTLSKYLAWHWCAAYLTPGGQAVQVWPRRVNTFWKPLLWFRHRGAPPPDNWIGDVCKSPVNDNDKRFHGWGQSENGMLDIVKRFTAPGDLVLDPFLGAGSTGVACIAAARSFIGYEIALDHAQVARGRLTEAQNVLSVAA